jgi:tRNA-modifying protein YgfZ
VTMADASIYALPERSVVAVTGPDARSWLDTLVSADLSALGTHSVALSALLSPQGKILFEFFVFASADGLLLDTSSVTALALMQRLKLYKLRAKIELSDVSAEWTVIWGLGGAPMGLKSAIAGPDPRSPKQMWRGVSERSGEHPANDGPYLTERVRLGVAEAPCDYALGDIFPHEANYDLTGGASFTKGCYVGQEVVSRMQNKTVVRKRVVRIETAHPFATGSAITTGSATIGAVGSCVGAAGLALLRLDRVAEAIDKGAAIECGGQSVTVDALAIARYRQSVKDRPVIDL